MRAIVVCVLPVCALIAAGRPASAAQKKEPEGSAWAATVAFEEGYTDNVRWTGDGSKRDDAWFETIEGSFDWNRLPWRYAPDYAEAGVRGRIFNGYSERDYAEVYSELGYELDRTTVSLGYDYVSNQIQVDEDASGDVIYAISHNVVLGVERKFGEAKRLRAGVEFEADWDDSQDSSDARDSFTPTGAVYVRYLVHELFMPRLGVSYGERDAENSNYDRDEFEVEAGIDSRPFEPLLVKLRYRRIERDYTVGSPTSAAGEDNSNYDREDDADHFEARLEYAIPYVEGLAVTARFRMRDNGSTRETHDFDVHEGGLGVSYTYR